MSGALTHTPQCFLPDVLKQRHVRKSTLVRQVCGLISKPRIMSGHARGQNIQATAAIIDLLGPVFNIVGRFTSFGGTVVAVNMLSGAAIAFMQTILLGLLAGEMSEWSWKYFDALSITKYSIAGTIACMVIGLVLRKIGTVLMSEWFVDWLYSSLYGPPVHPGDEGEHEE